jgi:uncharacterized protein YgiM (DUF1202 family)
LMLIAQLPRSRGIFTILFVLTLAGGCVSLGSLITIHVRNSSITGIVESEDAAVRSIPSDSATVRTTFPAGVSVRVVDRSDAYSLVADGNGVSGWILTESMRLD